MIDVMREAVNKGTGRRARVNGIEIAGKTGSTNENVDAWFCGFTPTIQAVIWYGRDDNTPIGHNETGGVAAAPAFSYFFEKLLKIEPGIKREFDVPRNVHRIIKDGELYYYTDTSKPKEEAPSMKEENLIF
jgi:penicillin-binding protein 1A